MSVIEFIGIARSGKTTVAKFMEKTVPGVTYYPERHDLIPKDLKKDNYKYNLWYAKYCVQALEEVFRKPGIHLFERGVIDHIVMGRAHFKMGWFTRDQFDEYISLLKPSAERVDKVFVFKIPVEESVKRAKNMGKDVTKAIPYISTLYKEYDDVKNWVADCIYLPETASLKELKQLMVKYI